MYSRNADREGLATVPIVAGQEQIEALSASAARDQGRRALGHPRLARYLNDLYPAEIDSLLSSALEEARAFGLRDRSAMGCWVQLCILLGSGFHTDPASGPWLHRGEGGPRVRFLELTRALAAGQAEPGPGVFPGRRY